MYLHRKEEKSSIRNKEATVMICSLTVRTSFTTSLFLLKYFLRLCGSAASHSLPTVESCKISLISLIRHRGFLKESNCGAAPSHVILLKYHCMKYKNIINAFMMVMFYQNVLGRLPKFICNIKQYVKHYGSFLWQKND